jgi:hypothetical protein
MKRSVRAMQPVKNMLVKILGTRFIAVPMPGAISLVNSATIETQ